MFWTPGDWIVNDGLVLYLDAGIQGSYPGSGTAWTDLAGSNDGTLTNGPTYSGANGGSIVFDGVDDYSTGSAAGLPSGSSARTIEIWANPGATADTQSALAYGVNLAGQRISIGANQDKFSVAVNGHEYGKAGLSLTGWQHYLVVYPGGGNSSTFDFYINTAQQTGLSTLAGSVQTVNTTISTNPLLIGGSQPPTPSLFYDGNIASVRIYNRALSATEITQNFEATRGRFGI